MELLELCLIIIKETKAKKESRENVMVFVSPLHFLCF